MTSPQGVIHILYLVQYRYTCLMLKRMIKSIAFKIQHGVIPMHSVELQLYNAVSCNSCIYQEARGSLTETVSRRTAP